MLNSLFSAFQMYSRIPTPKVEWRDENRRYSMCFFPLIGAVMGALAVVWCFVCDKLDIGSFLYGAGVFAMTVIVTGGIHLDGYCDTCDARASWGDRQKKLAILSDSHIGAFAAIKLAVYAVVYTALLSELNDYSSAVVIGCGYVLSRALSGFAAVTFRAAKKEGTLQSFSVPADKKTTVRVLIITAAVCCCIMMFFSFTAGTAASAAALLTMLCYRRTAYKEFGGITGDLEGWFLQMCEMWIAAAAVFALKLREVL
ncbi:MAG: adenosylcobinamide-GDP ribazoletransferase [Ruminococcus sp.]|uniref:adenosylcobinamide-GDP ribazoletransferase n=1 Tax=Ruminococcus sp. TaxID=41978 RepID=UPI0025F957FE|nr:adenosylcobinamide-GDP ribazoletransferase [Ruminococcus sp.]MCR5600915.1 adenosylcobinamide-GDP ribazoletransferase [Ruminococcus sp.]